MGLCVLISTCDKYRTLAEFTGRVIERYWPDHPPIYFCGCTNPPAENWLPLRRPSADWMGITQEAVRDLERRRYTKCYLILDDQPPLYPCHERHLNDTIPRLLDKLDAAYIGLSGWGQGRPLNGTLLGADCFWLENVSTEYLWKFQLHPALWRVGALDEILTMLRRELPEDSHTPWAFERKAGASAANLPDNLKRGAYRICGERMSRNVTRRALVTAERSLFWAFRFLAGRLFGANVWRRLDEAFGFLSQYYEGPYPLIWSGVTRKGQINPQFVRFLKVHLHLRLLRELPTAADAWPAPRKYVG